MVFPIVGGNQSTGDFITNSLRFNNPDDPNLSTTFGSAGNRRTFTISAWVKRGNIADDHTLFGQGGTSSGNPRGVLFFANSLRFTNNTSGSSTDTDVETNAKTRDPSAWYHAVVAVDTTQGTNSNRVKLYINGELQTSLATTTYPDQNFEMGWNNNVLHTVGRYPNNDAYHMDGYISEFYFIDGTQYAASDFGETNDNGVWIPKDAKDDLTFGTNGFYLQFQQTGTGTNASGMGADTSGNDNHLAVNNLAATDVTVDTPINNFSTGNPLIHIADGNITPSFSEGNTKWTSGANASYGTSGHGNIAVTNGKWYWEMKIDAGRNNGVTCGIAPTSVFENHYGTSTSTDYTFARDNLGSYGYQFSNSGSKKLTGTSGGNSSSYGSPNWSENDIIGVAMDLDNDTLTFYLNGSSQGEAFSSLPDVYYTPAWYGYYDTVWEFNAGNPYNAISSGNSDANGYGNFEYAVPSGFYSLCTKNLAEYG